MSGTIPYSLSQQLDKFGKPLAGGKLYIIQAGTTNTPQTAYQDGALTLPYPGGSTITLDAAGRVGQFFLADGLVKIRLTDKNGIPQVEADGIQVIGPSSGGGGGGAVDPTTVLATGDLKPRYGIGVLAGFVRGNGRTIGSAVSGATERANADTQALFEYLYVTDVNLTVSGGRGASANADWVANKTIALPDWRGRSLSFLADMGNSATTDLTATYYGADPTVLGQAGGGQSTSILKANLPNYNLDLSHLSFQTTASNTVYTYNTYQAAGGLVDVPQITGRIPLTFTTTLGGGSFLELGGSANPMTRIPPMRLATMYVKL